MTKLTLDETWIMCLEMWKWIVENYHKYSTISQAKDAWLEINGYDLDTILNDCFFCEYVGRDDTEYEKCNSCPGALVDNTFKCWNPNYNYHKPNLFYQKLLELDKIRRQNVG